MYSLRLFHICFRNLLQNRPYLQNPKHVDIMVYRNICFRTYLSQKEPNKFNKLKRYIKDITVFGIPIQTHKVKSDMEYYRMSLVTKMKNIRDFIMVVREIGIIQEPFVNQYQLVLTYQQESN